MERESEELGKKIARLFSAGAHQIKSPLNSLYTLLDVINYSFKDQLPEKAQKLLRSAIQKAEDLKILINDLLQLSKISEGIIDYVPVDLEKLVTDINMKISEIAKNKKVNFIPKISQTLPVVEADSTLLYNIIYNLAENGVSYTPAGGKVELEIEYKYEDKVLEIIVSDTGIGIPEEYIDKVFNEFFRAPNARKEKESGTGLGLSIVKKSVDLFGGRITVKSKPGKGTRFKVVLPLKITRKKKVEKRKKRVVIIGGGTAGAKTAAKLRRMDGEVEIVLIEKQEFLAYSGCGLPHYISGLVKDKRELMTSPAGELRDPEFFKKMGDIIVYNYTEAVNINRKEKKITIRSILSGETKDIEYDYLVIATGGKPEMPPIKGIHLKNIFKLRSMEDADRLKEILAPPRAKEAVIIGGGLIGMELAESLLIRGTRVTVIEREKHILPMFDEDVSWLIQNIIELKGIKFFTEEEVVELKGKEEVEEVITNKRKIPAEFVIVSTGIRPDVKLAQEAGVKIGKTGGIVVDNRMKTSDPYIFAVGDCVENVNLVTGEKVLMPLGSTASKHGRVCGINLGGGISTFKGIVKTVVFKIFNINAGKTGLTTKEAIEAGYNPISVLVPSLDRHHYYPDANLIVIKLIGDKTTEKLLGVQIFGKGDVMRRIDVAATALSKGMTIEELSDLDLAYLPACGLPLDPIIVAANVWKNYRYGDYKKLTAKELHHKLKSKDNLMLIDVRRPEEYEEYSIPDAINIPLGAIRAHAFSLPRDKDIVLICDTGLRSYNAYIILKRYGFENIYILDGGLTCWPYIDSGL